MADAISLGSIQASVGLNLQGLRQDVGETRNLLREMGANLRSETLKASEGVGETLKSGLTGAVQEAGESAMAGLRRWLQRLSPLVNRATRQASESVFAMTHSKDETARLRALSQFDRDVYEGVPSDLAAQRRDLALREVSERERRALQHLRDMRSLVGGDSFSRERLEAQRAFDKTVGGTESPAVRGEAALLYQAEIQEIVRRQTEAVLKQVGAAVSRGLGGAEAGTSSVLGAWSKEHQKQGFAVLGEALRGQLAQQRAAEGEASETRQRMKELEGLRAFEYRMGQLSLSDYRAFLQERLQALREYSPEWRRVQTEMFRLDPAAVGKASNSFRAQGREGVESMAQGIGAGGGLVRNALSTVIGESLFVAGRQLRRNANSVFGEILVRSITSLLSDVLENAIASIFKKRKRQEKKSGFVGSLLESFVSPVLGIFGFDDAANDSKARGWGWDFAKHFGRGVESYRAQRGGSSSPAVASSKPSVVVNAHFGDVMVRGEQDLRALEERIAWSVQRALHQRV